MGEDYAQAVISNWEDLGKGEGDQLVRGCSLGYLWGKFVLFIIESLLLEPSCITLPQQFTFVHSFDNQYSTSNSSLDQYP